MSTKTVDCLIVGAGVTGLCAATALGGNTLILEKEKEPGGYCRSFRRDGFIWDCAGHFFHFRTEEARRFFLSLFEPEELVVREKKSRVLYRGAYVDAPFQTHLHQLDKEELIDCLCDLFHREAAEEYGSFLDMLYGRFGRAVTEKFLRPYNEKLYACDLRTLDEKAMGRFFPCPDLTEIVDGMKRERSESYNSVFYYPKAGAGALVEKLCQRLDPARLLTGRALVALDLRDKTATDSEGGRYRYERLVNTSPLHRFLPLLHDEAADALAARLSCNKVLVYNLGFERGCPERKEHWVYVPDQAVSFYRFGFYNNLLGTEAASMYLEIGFPESAVIDEQAELQRALAALRQTGVLAEDNRLLAYDALVMDPAYVHVRPDTERELSRLREELARRGVYTIGRYGGWRYSSMEDGMLEARALAEKLKNGKERQDS